MHKQTPIPLATGAEGRSQGGRRPTPSRGGRPVPLAVAVPLLCPPADVLDPELVRTVFGVTCTHLTHPVTGGLLLAFSPQQVAPVTGLGGGASR
ncbi:hypothetical protein ABZ702_15045 [Streptomyces cyaneofuscatus]|uniref:hypothetical protein n=1 Tax=Streptomyces cyaneofuscatus TaxID=66883 RepID=UPI003400E57E